MSRHRAEPRTPSAPKAKDVREQNVPGDLFKRLTPWPTTPLRRVLIVLGFSVPFYAVLWITAMHGGFDGVATPNSLLLSAAANEDPIVFAADYPPVRNLLIFGAHLFFDEYAALALALLGCFLAAFALAELSEILWQKRTRGSVGTALLLPLFATPILYYNALFSITNMLLVVFSVFALAHLVRFARWGSAHSGFMAGILFAAATLTSTTGFLLLGAGLLTLAVYSRLHAGIAKSIRGTSAVLLFPTMVVFTAFTAVSTALTGKLFISNETDFLQAPGLSFPYADAVIDIPWLDGFSIGPLQGYAAVLALAPIPFLLVATARWQAWVWVSSFGLLLTGLQLWTSSFNPVSVALPSALSFLLVTLVAIVFSKEPVRAPTQVMLIALATVQIAVGWSTALARPTTITPFLLQLFSY